MKIFGLIQARMDSVRLPGKVMMEISGVPIVEHIRRRLEKITILDGVILATTTKKSNDVLEQWAKSMGVICYRHPEEEDICGRIFESFKITNADYFLKINSDCPLIDHEVLQVGIDLLMKNKDCDYISNKIEHTFAWGYTFEIVSKKAIAYCNNNLKEQEDRELVLMWIKDHPNLFKVLGFKDYENFSRFNLCVDTPDDLLEVKGVYENLSKLNQDFSYNEVKRYLEKQGK